MKRAAAYATMVTAGGIVLALYYVFGGLLLLLLTATVSNAQTLSPLTNECNAKCSGQFTFTNNGLTPLVVSVDAASFTPRLHGGIMRPLDSGVRVQLSAISARIPPKSSYVFTYKIACLTLPCSVQLLAAYVAGHTTQGLEVKVVLGHAVYVCDRQKGCRSTVLRNANVIQ